MSVSFVGKLLATRPVSSLLQIGHKIRDVRIQVVGACNSLSPFFTYLRNIYELTFVKLTSDGRNCRMVLDDYLQDLLEEENIVIFPCFLLLWDKKYVWSALGPVLLINLLNI